MSAKDRVERARELMKQASPTQRIHVDRDGNVVLRDVGVERNAREAYVNSRKPNLSKNALRASRGIARHHESNKNKRFARDEDFGQ